MMAVTLGCQDFSSKVDVTELSSEPEQKTVHNTQIVSSRNLGTLEVQLGDRTEGVRCGVCHTTTNESPANRPDELTEFHTEMEFGHGDLTCNACHNPEDRDQLRLADGRSLAFENTLLLCAQCHGPQMRDYRRGAHGGMKGHWDLNKGPRTRNHCVNCHDPHDPAFPKMFPAPPPRDRLMPKKKEEADH